MAISNRDRIGKMFELLAPALDDFIARVGRPAAARGRLVDGARGDEGQEEGDRGQGVRPPRSAGAAADADREHPAQPQAGLVPVRRRDRPRRAGVRQGAARGPQRLGAQQVLHRRRRLPLPGHRRAAARRDRRAGGRRRGQGDPPGPAPADRRQGRPEGAEVRGGHARVGGAAPVARGAAAARRRRDRQLPGRRVRRRPLQGRRDGEDAGKDYAEPVEFFARTYLTEGLRDLIDRAVRRLAGDQNASPVINLQTNFGGGKTHSMLALWHLASGTPLGDYPAGRPGAARRDARSASCRGVRRVALVGNHISPVRRRSRPTARRSTRSGASSPGSSAARRRSRWSRRPTPTAPRPGEALHELLSAYAPGGDPDRRVGRLRAQPRRRATTSPAARSTTSSRSRSRSPRRSRARRACCSRSRSRRRRAATTPSRSPATPRRSAARTASRRSSACRTSCAASPTSGGPRRPNEAYHIVRQRLFSHARRRRARVDQRDGARRSSRCTTSYADDFPREARDGGYEDRIKQTYPIHPELFDRLYEDWSSLERFQRTRGVLRLMNTVIHALWVGRGPVAADHARLDPARRPRR